MKISQSRSFYRGFLQNKMSTYNITLSADHGWFLASVVGFYLQQAIVFVIPVVKQRLATGIKAPTLYPSDSEIKKLNLTETQVADYTRAQRVHQNNMEFLSCYMPIYLMSGLLDPLLTAKAGAAILALRCVNAAGYLKAADSPLRKVGGLFHLPEFYTVYLIGKRAYDLVK